MNPQGILDAANLLSLPALGLVVMGALLFAGVKIVDWGKEVTTLLGNHLRHDLASQTEALSRIEANLNTLARIESSLNEQTLVLRALGRMMMEQATGKREF